MGKNLNGVWKNGTPPGWAAVRAAVMRSGSDCEIKIRNVCTGVAQCVHHVQGNAADPLDVRYLKRSCNACNLHIGDPTRQHTGVVELPDFIKEALKNGDV